MKEETFRCRGDHLPPHKYIRNTYTCGTAPTEHLLNAGRRPQTSQKTRNSPRTWVGKRKKKNQRQKNRDGTCTSARELWRRKGVHTLGSPFTGGDCRWQRGEDSEPRRRAQPQGCGGQSGEIPARTIGANQHSPAREACLLTRRGGRGLGAEARASVGSQGEDWGWWREHSLKGASVPQLAGRESRKKSGAAEGTGDFFLPLCFTVRKEKGFRVPLKQTPEMGASRGYPCGPQRCSETLRLLLPPPRSLCASTGHYPHLPSRKPVQRANARVPWSRGNFPRRTHGAQQAGATSCWPLPPQARPTLCTPPSSRPKWARAPKAAAPLTPSWVKNRRPQATYRQSGVQMQSWTSGALQTKKRKGNLSHQPQEQRI